jgi:hypothetical protein
MDFGWIITLVFLLVAVVFCYVAYAKVRAGQQPGEAWIDALLAQVRGKASKTTETKPEDSQ